MKTSAFIICWPGKEKNARYIAKRILTYVDQLVVIYSTKNNSLLSGAGKWIQVPDDWYYGKKFKKTLELNKCDSMIHIHADAYSDNWIKLVKDFKETKKNFPNLGIWMPIEKKKRYFVYSNILNEDYKKFFNINDTNALNSNFFKENNISNRYNFVCQSHTTVWGVTKKVILRMKKNNYEFNNLGWGIDSVALAYAYCNNLIVVRDNSSSFKHKSHQPRTKSNYNHANALIQMNFFLKQLTLQERLLLKIFHQYFLINLKINKKI